MNILDGLKNLLKGKITVHQDFINKFIQENLADNKVVREIVLSVDEGLLNATVVILAGADTAVDVKLALSLGNHEFNKSSRTVELTLLSPITVSVCGIHIETNLSAKIDEAEARRHGAPEGLIRMFDYLSICEDKVVLDFNKMPGFNQALQNKLGFLLNNLEITKLELQYETIVIHPAVKLF